jgi:hypothetical protein
MKVMSDNFLPEKDKKTIEQAATSTKKIQRRMNWFFGVLAMIGAIQLLLLIGLLLK